MRLSHVTIMALMVGIGVPSIGLVQDGAAVHGQGANGTSHKGANVLFSAPLQDVPGKELVVVGLEFKPKGKQPAVPHRHPGSVYVYVTRGTARLGLEGQPVQEVQHRTELF